MSWKPDPQWDAQMEAQPIKSCGRLDMSTYMPTEETLGRVTSDRVRYVYFEDAPEAIVLGTMCDHVAYRAAAWQHERATVARLRGLLGETIESVEVDERAARELGLKPAADRLAALLAAIRAEIATDEPREAAGESKSE